ncbi:MAG: hypothetical protein LBU32_12295 [Clostridiales bacterium]|jgi:nitrogenase molybdenum-iron protein beta chain|nr:hypothetical protein [Clostridiales bacterium]
MAENSEGVRSLRTGCALQGALAALSEINGVIPIVHGNAGCAAHRNIACALGAAGEGAIGGFETPSTNIFEKQVVFGGGSRLREQIKNTVKTLNGSLYVVLGSCESAMVGDDILGMAREAAEQGAPVLASDVAGFRGNARDGYVRVFKDIIEAAPELRIALPREAPAAAVNIFGIVPREDVRFRGDLFELKRIAEALGIRANLFFGAENGAEQLAAMPAARLDLVFSKWGVELAERLRAKYGIPALIYASPPSGFDEVAALVADIAKALGLDKKVSEAFIQKEKKAFDYFLRGLREKLYSRIINKSVAIVGSEGESRQIGGFLSRYFGAEITAIITDGESKEPCADYAKNYYCTNDAGKIRCLLKNAGADIVFGSSLEKDASIGFIESSYPVLDYTVLSKTYTGTIGAVALAEEFASIVRLRNKDAESKLAEAIRENNIKGILEDFK